MEASWLQNPFPSGLCLKNGVHLENITIQHDFGMSRGMFFHVMLGNFLIYVRVGFRTPFGSPFFRFLGHVGGQLGAMSGSKMTFVGDSFCTST